MSRVFDAAQLNPNATLLTTPANAVYNNLTAWTHAFWVFPTAMSSYGAVLVKDATGNYTIDVALVLFGGLIRIEGDASFSIQPASTLTSTEIADNVWSHITLTFDFVGDKKIHVYINGVEATYTAFTAASGTVGDGSASGYTFGGDTFDGDGFTGNLAEIAIWNTALTAGQVATLAASTTGASAIQSANLVGYWHLCGLASPEPDTTVNGNNAVLSSNPPTPGPNSPGFSSCGGSPVVTRNGSIMISTIQKAVLLATGSQATNYAVYQVDAGPEIQVGETVVIAGCTTGTFNGTFTVAATGTFVVPNNPSDTSGGVSTWTGFSVIINHAAIGIEVEPTVPTDGAEGSPVGTATATINQ